MEEKEEKIISKVGNKGMKEGLQVDTNFQHYINNEDFHNDDNEDDWINCLIEEKKKEEENNNNNKVRQISTILALPSLMRRENVVSSDVSNLI